MESSSGFLIPSSSTRPKLRQINDAKEMQQAVLDRATRTGVNPPPYEFLELIGKGTYGRVYKSISLKSTNEQVVAIKIIEVDRPDYEASFEARDDTIQNFTKEISALQRLKDSNARNITMIFEAFTFHSQLWLVSEYCQGGSVTTLLKACPDRRMEEQFIIPLARELAIALKYIHDADIVHRDIKCANVLIMEDGTLRLADFGVAGIFETNVAKRRTIIGTPHWMPLELVKELGNESADIQYGTEVDCWAYGCAVFEMATGHGPNNRVRPMELANALRQTAPRLPDDPKYPERLREFVDFCLQNDPEARPSAKQILEHPYLANTSKRYPTESLQILVKQFYGWESDGGERKSLFYDFGAALPENLGERDPDQEDWYFSTTLEFEQRLENEVQDAYRQSLAAETSTQTGPAKLTPRERRLQAEKDGSAERGAKALGAIFDKNANEYTYSERFEPQRRTSDLPFRNMGTDRAADRTTMIDLDMADAGFESVPSLADISTLRANRANRFFSLSDDEDEEDEEDESDNTYARPDRNSNRKTTDWKMPLLTAPADVNSNRRTVDWKFPTITTTDTAVEDEDSGDVQRTSRKLGQGTHINDTVATAKRDTLAFKFPAAAAGAASSTESLPLPAVQRPPLKHAATMPVGQIDDDGLSTSPDRSSMIDLDFAVPDLVSQPSTAGSSFTFTETPTVSGDPFDLEDLTEVSSRTLTAVNNRTSHRQSYSEPNARASGGSEFENQIDLNASWHAREPSATSEIYMNSNTDRRFVDPLNERKTRDRRRMQTRDSGDTNGSVAGSVEGSVTQTRVYQPTGSTTSMGSILRPGTSYRPSAERRGVAERRDRKALLHNVERAARGLNAYAPVMKLLYGINGTDQTGYKQQYRRYLELGRAYP